MVDYKFNLLRDDKDSRDYLFKNIVKVGELPKSVDLRDKMPPIQDQGNLGSCTANAGSANRIYLTGNKDLELSRLYLYYKERELMGTINEDSGATMKTICKVLNKSGICEEKFMPYDIKKFAEKPSCDAEMNANDYKVGSYYRVANINEMKQALANGLPVLAGIVVCESFVSKVGSDGFIPMPKTNEKVLGGHAVLLVGMKDKPEESLLSKLLNLLTGKMSSKGHFILRNSWSEEWGDKGYGYAPYEVFDKIKNGDMWVIKQ